MRNHHANNTINSLYFEKEISLKRVRMGFILEKHKLICFSYLDMSPLSDLKWVSMSHSGEEVVWIRDREGTKKKILRAVGHILETRGFQDIGINNIARESGVDKVLIYRYFGGLQELLHSFAEQGDYWPTTNDITTEEEKNIKNLALPDASVALLRGYLRELKKNPSAQEILRGELMSKNDLALETAETREKQGRDLINLLDLEPGLRDRIDVTAVAALLSAGFTYLVLRSKTSGTYLGLDLNSEEDWERIEKALDQLVRSVFDHALKQCR